MSTMHRRKWWPDVRMIADQLIADYRDAKRRPDAMSSLNGVELWQAQGDSDAVGTIISWQEMAKDHGEEFQEDDWVALVQELGQRASGVTHI